MRKRKRTRANGWTRGWEWIKGDGGGMSGWTSNVGSHNEPRQNPWGRGVESRRKEKRLATTR